MELFKINNWGAYPIVEAEVHQAQQAADLPDIVRQQSRLIARGNGRCYGDSSLQKNILSTRPLQQILAFDPQRALLRAEAGCTLGELLHFLVPQGFSLAVLPGSKFISLGGAIAANAHGKNHRVVGAFANWIKRMRILQADGSIVDCSPEEQRELFYTTIGGMGLTGVILTAEIEVLPIETSYLQQESVRSRNLDETMQLLADATGYAVAWLDGTVKGEKRGRGLVSLGQALSLAELPAALQAEPLKAHEKKSFKLPAWFPTFLLNNWSIQVFNRWYYHRLRGKRTTKQLHYDAFFFPLDAMSNWNRLYGKKGFVQYQFVLPLAHAKSGLTSILTAIEQSSVLPYLSVLKLLGKEKKPVATLSFPKEGYTLALDFPRTPEVLQLLLQLDDLVVKYEGRVYLAKDARLSRVHFKQMYPQGFPHPERFHSLQSERLDIS